MRTFDRLVEFDERSRAYPIRTLVGDKPIRPYTWKVAKILDQGQEGACVGFSWTHELISRPVPITSLGETHARRVYKEAQKIDEWPGEEYDGTSILAGAKVVKKDNLIQEYRWAFGMDDALRAVGNAGPGVFGTNWYEGMFEPDENGFIHPTGYIAGGHAILVNGVNLKQKYVTLTNSWGQGWGTNGTCKLSFTDFDRLLHERGELCIPLMRRR